MIHLQPFVDGRALSSPSERMPLFNPATGQPVGSLPVGSPADVDAAVAAAIRAAPAWAALSLDRRAELLEALADAIEARLDAFAAMESADQGKPVSLARRIDIPRAVSNFRFFARAARMRGMPAYHRPGRTDITLERPHGVVGLITPWNLPLYLLTWKLAPALVCGNTVVAKPSELTPRTAAWLAELAVEVGIPAGVFNLVHGLGQHVGQALVEHPDVKAISFTGGTATGAKVAAAASPRFKKLSLELGGKNATLIFDDADLDQAITVATRAAFTNQGEICLCGSRLLVQRAAYDRVVAGVVAQAKALTVGDPEHPDTHLGALVSAEHRAKVEGYIALGQEEGGTLLAGGHRPPIEGRCAEGYFLQPTVFTDLDIGCRTATEEIFGPVLTIHPFDTEAEALAMANATPYGLSSSVWTQDLARAHRVGHGLDVGMVWVNTWLDRDLRTAFGGAKQSGVGREGGRWSLDFFSQTKNLCLHHGSS